MRRGFILGSVVMLLVATPLTVLAVTAAEPAGGAHINCMATSTLGAPVTTSRTTFTEIGGLQLSFGAVWGLTESVTVVVKGAPIRLKAINMTVGGPLEMAPGIVTLDPTSSETNSFSITFVGDGLAAYHYNQVLIEWRVVHAGDSATIVRATASLIYETEECPFI